MDWSAWVFSAKLAWHHPWVRWMSLTSVALLLVSSTFYLWRVVPAARHNGTAVIHYNIYLGIDDVRHWSWVLGWPALWALVTGVDLAWAYGSYREDRLFSLALVSLAFFWGLPWASALFYLSLMNV